MKWSGIARSNARSDSRAGLVARAAITDDTGPGHRHELRRPSPLTPKPPTSPPVMRTLGEKSYSAKPDVKGNSPAKIRR